MSITPFITIQELEQKLAKKEISREDILEFYLRRFEAFDGEIGSALEIFDKESNNNNSFNIRFIASFLSMRQGT